MRPSDKARGARISGIFERRATQSGGMQRRSNAGGLLPRAARFTVVWRRLRGSNSHAREGITGFKPDKHASLASLRLEDERVVCLARVKTQIGDPDEIRTRNYEVEGLVA